MHLVIIICNYKILLLLQRLDRPWSFESHLLSEDNNPFSMKKNPYHVLEKNIVMKWPISAFFLRTIMHYFLKSILVRY